MYPEAGWTLENDANEEETKKVFCVLGELHRVLCTENHCSTVAGAHESNFFGFNEVCKLVAQACKSN